MQNSQITQNMYSIDEKINKLENSCQKLQKALWSKDKQSKELIQISNPNDQNMAENFGMKTLTTSKYLGSAEKRHMCMTGMSGKQSQYSNGLRASHNPLPMNSLVPFNQNQIAQNPDFIKEDFTQKKLINE